MIRDLKGFEQCRIHCPYKCPSELGLCSIQCRKHCKEDVFLKPLKRLLMFISSPVEIVLNPGLVEIVLIPGLVEIVCSGCVDHWHCGDHFDHKPC